MHLLLISALSSAVFFRSRRLNTYLLRSSKTLQYSNKALVYLPSLHFSRDLSSIASRIPRPFAEPHFRSPRKLTDRHRLHLTTLQHYF